MRIVLKSSSGKYLSTTNSGRVYLVDSMENEEIWDLDTCDENEKINLFPILDESEI